MRAFRSVGGTPYFVRRGQGAYVIDEAGKRYVDYVQSYGHTYLRLWSWEQHYRSDPQDTLRLLDEGRYRVALVVVRPALLPLAHLRWPQAVTLTPGPVAP